MSDSVDTVAPAITPAAARASAGGIAEPKNGDGWHVVWWNESVRMMLPDGARLDHINQFRNGTKVLTIKRAGPITETP